MSIISEIKCGIGASNRLCITNRHAALVTPIPGVTPALGTENPMRYYTYTLDNMNVDGSVTPQKFALNTVQNDDLIIQRMSFVVADSAINMNTFGNIDSLTNGVDVIIHESGFETVFVDKAVTNSDLLIKSGGHFMFGSNSTSEINEIGNWESNRDAFLAVVDFTMIPTLNGINGIRLGASTGDKIEVTVNDDLTDLDEFTVRFYGVRHVRNVT